VSRYPGGPIQAAGMLASVGLVLVVSVMLGFFLGRWLDSRLHTEPWLTLAGLALGTAAGFMEMFRIAKHYLGKR